MRLLFKHYPQIRRVSSFTVYAFKVSTFLQSSVYINESLTAYRRRLFGKMLKFTHDNNWGVLSHSRLTQQNFIFDVIVVFNLNLDHLFGGKVLQTRKETGYSLAPSELSSQHFAEQWANPYTADHLPICLDVCSTMCYQQNGRQNRAIFEQQFL